MIERLREVDLRAGAGRIAAGILVVGALFAAWDYRAAHAAAARSAVEEMREVLRLAAEAEALAKRDEVLSAALGKGAASVVSAIEAEAAAAGIGRLDEVTPNGEAPTPAGGRRRWEIRVRGVGLGPLLRFLERAERSRGGLVVAGLSLRTSPAADDRLDATVLVDVVEP